MNRFVVSRDRRILKVYELDDFDELKKCLNRDFGIVDDLTVIAELEHHREIWAFHVRRKTAGSGGGLLFIVNEVTGVVTPFDEIPNLATKNWNLWIGGQYGFSMKFHSVGYMKEFFAGINAELFNIYVDGDLVKVFRVDEIDHGIELEQFEI